MSRAAWMTVVFLSSAIAVYAAAVFVVPGFGPPFIEHVPRGPFAAHLAGGILALAVGPWQFYARLRERAIEVHRFLGRTYVVGVLFGGSGGLMLAPTSQEGMVTHLGFGLLAVLWLASTGQGYLSIRRGDEVSHRAWMMRSFALTLAAVTLRIILPVELAAGVSFHHAYRIVSWSCWVPNLIVAEWLIGRVPVSARSGARHS